MPKRALLIMGPTASGKSALALALAERIGGEIVNADLMQVYRDFRILTARPTLGGGSASAPHHLYGHVDAAELYSTGRWLADALAAIAANPRARRNADPRRRHRALLQSADARLGRHPRRRSRNARRFARTRSERRRARACTPNSRRAIRKPPRASSRTTRRASCARSKCWRRPAKASARCKPTPNPRSQRDEWRGLALTPDREALYAAINARFDEMLAPGALDEVRAFAARELDPALPAMKAHGAPALMAHLRGEITLARRRRDRPARHAPLRQAPIHLDRQPNAGLAARHGAGFGGACRAQR